VNRHTYHGRRAVSIDNERARVTVLEEGGHIAEVFDKRSGVNPLWTPPWQTIEPSLFDKTIHGSLFGDDADGKLLAGIMGHNLCLDIFGGPSREEAAAGLTAHGEASIARYEVVESDEGLTMRAVLPMAQLSVERRIGLSDRTASPSDGQRVVVAIHERLESQCSFDRPIGWTEHVTLGPPFLEKGRTEFRVSATRSRVFESQFGVADYLRHGACFEWPAAPRSDGRVADLRLFTNDTKSSAYTAHLMDPDNLHAFFIAYSPTTSLAFGYLWKQSDFPWLGIWEENCSRAGAPWHGMTMTRGMEFGVSPFPETRREMVDRGAMFETPTFRWLPAHGVLEATYWILLQTATTIPNTFDWPLTSFLRHQDRERRLGTGAES